MLTCIKQHLSNIWSSIHEKVKQHWGWVEKKAMLIKKACIGFDSMKMKLETYWFRMVRARTIRYLCCLQKALF